MKGILNVSYQNLDIYKIAYKLVIELHEMTLKDLPRFEMYEEGSQIRRSIKSVKSNIIEGFGRKRYKNEYIKFLTYAIASNDETKDHLKNLFDTKSLNNSELYNEWQEKLNTLGKKLYLFQKSI